LTAEKIQKTVTINLGAVTAITDKKGKWWKLVTTVVATVEL